MQTPIPRQKLKTPTAAIGTSEFCNGGVLEDIHIRRPAQMEPKLLCLQNGDAGEPNRIYDFPDTIRLGDKFTLTERGRILRPELCPKNAQFAPYAMNLELPPTEKQSEDRFLLYSANNRITQI